MIDEVNAEVPARQFEATPSSHASEEGQTAGPLETDECFAGVSSHVAELRNFVREQAKEKHPALLIGERGLRQEQIVSAIHRMVGQSSHSFYSVAAREHGEATLNDLLASPSGLIGGCPEGTVFIDDVTSLPNSLQRRLAIHINERGVGEQGREAPGARLIFAAYHDGGGAGADNNLFHRLIAADYPARFHLKPLRERRDDIPHIVACLVKRIAARDAKGPLTVSPEAMESLASYDWGRNIEELESVLESALAQIRPLQINPARLPSRIRCASFRQIPEEGIDLERVVDEYERAMVPEALRQTGGKQTAAARMLRLQKQTLNMKLSRWNRMKR